jgi:membrane-bound lytic murein transglycosylase B
MKKRPGNTMQNKPLLLAFGAGCLVISLLLGMLPAGIVRSAEEGPLAADLVTDNQPIDISTEKYQRLLQELEEDHHFSKQQLTDFFSGLRIDRKVLQLMDRQGEAKPYYQYRPLFVTPTAIAVGKQSLVLYQTLFDRIEREFGVDREVIVAIWGIETRFGTSQGNFKLIRTLNTLFAAYPRRSDFFRTELINFLILCRDNKIAPQSVKGSYAGAFGQAQFMPSSFNQHAVDFDGDNRRDLINSLPDIFASIANYLSKFGWTLDAPVYAEIGTVLNSETLTTAYQTGRKGLVDWQTLTETQQIDLPRPPLESRLSIVGLEVAPQEGGGLRFVAGYPNFQAITEYNHSDKYAMAVTELAEALKN